MNALAHGYRSWRNRFLLVPSLYAVKLILAALLTLPLLALISEPISRSLYPNPLMQRWDLGIIAELAGTQQGVAPSFMVLLFSFLLLSFLVKQFLNGGIYTTFLANQPIGLRTFFAESAAQFRSQLRISALMLPIYLILAFAGSTLGALIPESLFGHFGNAAAISRLAPLAVTAAFLLIGIIFSETLRLHRAAVPDQHGLARLRTCLDFLRNDGVRLYGYYLVWFAPYFVLWVLIEWLALTITQSSGGSLGVLAEMILFQICVVVRTAQSLLYTATAATVVGRAVWEQVYEKTEEIEKA